MMEPSGLPSLEDLCLCKLRYELECFPVSSLSLLPHCLRNSLLCGLPAADLCKLEVCPQVLKGVCLNSIWKILLDYFVGLLFCHRTPTWSTDSFGPFLETKFLLPLAKENFLAMVSKLVLTTTDGRLEYFAFGKWKLIAALLYGLPGGVSAHRNSIAIPTSTKSSIHVPSRYASHLTDVQEKNLAEMISQVMNVFNLGPKVIQFCWDEAVERNLVSVDDTILLPFLSRVEEFGVHLVNSYHYEADPYCNLLTKIVSSQLSSINRENAKSAECSLHTLRLKGYHTNLELVFKSIKASSLLSYSSHHSGHSWNDPVYEKIPYTKLKKVELTPVDRNCELAETLWGSKDCRLDLCCDAIASILYSQDELEVVNMNDLYSVQNLSGGLYYVYSGFEKLYFFLPLIIARPSFRSLKLDRCSLPINAAETIICTFLCTPTTHAQSLDLSGCSLYKAETISLPRGCPKPPTVPETAPCLNGNLKSLSIFINNGLSSFTWLLNHPNMNLGHLELFCNPTTVDKPLKDEIVEPSDSSDIDEENDDDDDSPGTKRKKIDVKGEDEGLPQKDSIKQLCDFICELDQPEKLDVHIICTDALSSPCKHLEANVVSADSLSLGAKEGIERVCSLPTLTSFTFEKCHWSLDPSYYGVNY